MRTREPGDESQPGPGDWWDPDMTLLGSGRAEPPDCPVEKVFSEPMATWLRNAAALASAPVDYVVGALLSFTCPVIGMTRLVSPWPGWSEPILIWYLSVGDSGDGKSPADASVVKAVHKLQSKVNHATREQYLGEMKAWEAAPEEGRGEKPESPRCLQIIAEDTSAEALLDVLINNPRGVMRHGDEIKGLIKSFGRYYAKGEGGERQAMLSAYDAKPRTVNRQSFKDDPNGDGSSQKVIEHFYVCMGGGVQPDAADFLLEGDDDGFVARFPIFFPNPVPRARPTVEPDDAFLFELFEWLHEQLDFSTDSFGGKVPQVIQFASDAADYFEDWWKAQKAEMAPYSGLYKSWLAKSPGRVVRLSGWFELVDWGIARKTTFPPTKVSLGAVKRAVVLVDDYLRLMAERFFGEAAKLPTPERNAMAIAKLIAAGRVGPIINQRDILRTRINATLVKAAEVAGALEILKEAHWIRPRPSRAGSS